MREIKFRAWHKADKKMYEVYGFAQNKSFRNHLFWFLKGKKFPMPNGAVVIMQYIGLKDKNGKEIYEGDVCETLTKSGPPYRNIDYVKFSSSGFKLIDIYNKLSPLNLDDKDIISIEVIGNVFEDMTVVELEGEK